MTMSGWARKGRMGELDPATAELYRRQAAAAAGAGRAAQAASEAASVRGQAETQAQEQAQAAVMQRASDFGSGTVRHQPHYLRTALIFGAVGVAAYFVLRPPRPRGRR